MRRYSAAGSLVGSHFSLLLVLVLVLGCGAQEEAGGSNNNNSNSNNNNNNNNGQLSCVGGGGGDDNAAAAVAWTCVAVVAIVLIVVGVIAWKQRGQHNTWLGGGGGLLPCCWKPEKNLVLETVSDKTEKNKDLNAINNGNFGEITPVTAQVSVRFEKTLDGNRTVSAEHRFLDELQTLTARYPGIVVDVVPPAFNDAAAAAIPKNGVGVGGSVRKTVVKCYRNAVSAVRQRMARSENNPCSSGDGVTDTKTTCNNTTGVGQSTTTPPLDEPDGKRRETVIQITTDDANQYHSLEYSGATEQSPKEDRHRPDEGVSKETDDGKPSGRDARDPESRGDEPANKTETKHYKSGSGGGEVTVVCERKTLGQETSDHKKHDHATISIDEHEEEEKENDFKEVPLNDNVVAAVVNGANVGRDEEPTNSKEKSPPPPPPPRKHSSLATAESANKVVVDRNNGTGETEIEKSPPLLAADHHHHHHHHHHDHGKGLDNDEYALDNTDNSSADDGVSYNINDITDSGILIEDTTIPSSSDEDMDNVVYTPPPPPVSPRNTADDGRRDDFHKAYDDDGARRQPGGGDKTIGSKKTKTPPPQIIKSNHNVVKSESLTGLPPISPDHQPKYGGADGAEHQKTSVVGTKVPRVIQPPHESSAAGTTQGNAVVSPSKIPVRRSSSGNNGLNGAATSTPVGATVSSKKWSPSSNGSVSKLINT